MKQPPLRRSVPELATIQDAKPWHLKGMLGRFDLRLSKEVEELAVSPDGLSFVTRERYGYLTVFDTQSGDTRWRLEDYSSGFAIHDRKIFVTQKDGVIARSLLTGKMLPSVPALSIGSPWFMMASRDGTRLVHCDYDKLGVFDLKARCSLYQSKSQMGQPALIAPSGRFVIARNFPDNSSKVVKLDLETGQEAVLFPDDIKVDCGAMLISSDERWLYARGWKGLLIYDLQKGAIHRNAVWLGSDMKPWSMALSPDDRTLALSHFNDGRFYSTSPVLFDARTLRKGRSLPIDDVQRMSFTPNGESLVVVKGDEHQGASVESWGLDGRRVLPQKDTGHNSTVHHITSTRKPKSKSDTVISGSADGTIRLWSLGKSPQSAPTTVVRWGLPVAEVDIDQQGTKISACSAYLGGFHHSAGVWRLSDHKKIARFDLKHETRGYANHYKECNSARLSPDGGYWAQIRQETGEDQKLFILDVRGRRPVEHEVPGAMTPSQQDLAPRPGIVWFPDSERILVTDSTGLSLVDVNEKKVLQRFQSKETAGIISAALDIDSGVWLLCSVGNGFHKLVRLSLATGEVNQPQAATDDHRERHSYGWLITGTGARIEYITTSPLGWLGLVTKEEIRIHKAGERKSAEISLGKMSGEIESIAFSKDAKRLFAGTRQGPILVFERG